MEEVVNYAKRKKPIPEPWPAPPPSARQQADVDHQRGCCEDKGPEGSSTERPSAREVAAGLKCKLALGLIRDIAIETTIIEMKLSPALVKEASQKIEALPDPNCEIVEELQSLHAQVVILSSRIKL